MRNTLYRDRLSVLLVLIAITALAWIQMIRMTEAMQMPGMGTMPGLPEMSRMTMGDTPMKPDMGGGGMAQMAGPLTLALMWIVMMIAMMLPATTAMVLAFSGINAAKRKQGRDAVPTLIFVAGYIVVWLGFGLAAAALQTGLQYLSLMGNGMNLSSPALCAVILVASGLYQFTTWKHVCLQHCRSPLGFILNDWREGRRGAFLMGFHHGMFCLGCCWVLMLVMFAIGTMNLLLMITITLYILVEKLLPFPVATSRLTGAALMAAGLATATGHLTWGVS